MTRTRKQFDSVELKNRIQSRLAEEHRGLSEQEIERRLQEWLETSDDPLARLWRETRARTPKR